MPLDTTFDGILGRRIALEQPKQGFRVAVDTVLLAASVPAIAGQNVLDMGCGVGGAMLCLAARVPGVQGMGIEIQPELAALCRSNITANKMEAGLSVEEGDITKLPGLNAFDHVIMNPPYHEERRHDASANAIKRAANMETEGDLPLWVAAAVKNLKPDGILTIIHRADRRDEILALMQYDFGRIEMLSVLPREGEAPKRIILRGHRQGAGGVVTCQPLILHKAEGGFSDAAEAVLRHAKEVAFIA